MANTPENKVSRRTLAKGAAWAAPAFAVAAAAPAYAQSLTDPTVAIASAVRTTCYAAEVTFTGTANETYVVQASRNCSDWSGTRQVTASGSSENIVVMSSAQPVNCVRIASGTYTNQVLTQTSEWVVYNLAALTGATGFTLSGTAQNRRFSWTTPAGLTNLGPSFTISATNPDSTYGPTTANEVMGVDNHNSATLTTSVCGLTFTAQWPVNGLLREPSPNNAGVDTAEDTKVEAPATEPQKKGIKPAEAGPSAPKKSTPVEPAPTVAPEPKVTVAPEPAPIVSEAAPVPAPEPVVSPTPAG